MSGWVVLAEGDPLLKPGQKVMFFIRHNKARGWNQMVSPGYGDARIEDGQPRDDLVRRFEWAERHQTDPTRGRRNSSTSR